MALAMQLAYNDHDYHEENWYGDDWHGPNTSRTINFKECPKTPNTKNWQTDFTKWIKNAQQQTDKGVRTLPLPEKPKSALEQARDVSSETMMLIERMEREAREVRALEIVKTEFNLTDPKPSHTHDHQELEP